MRKLIFLLGLLVFVGTANAQLQLSVDDTTAKIPVFMADSADHFTGKTGLTPTCKKSENGGTAASLAGSIAEVNSTDLPGVYVITLAAGDVDTEGSLVITCTASGADPANVMAQLTGGLDLEALASVISTAVWGETTRQLTGTQSFNLTGNITGNLSGSVGSVTGAVGSVTGAVGSVTGNVGGNVAGSVASVTGAVGSVTGNVGGSVASVTGAVGSVTGNVGGNVAGSVGSVATGGIAAASFAAGAIDASAIAANAIGASELADNSIDAGAIADGAIDAGAIADASVDAATFVAGAIDASAIAADAVGASEIAANALGASEVADGAIDAGAIATDAITAAKIQANAITSSELAQSAADLVWSTTARTITGGTISTLDTGAISSGSFGTGAINAAAIATDAIGSSELSQVAADKVWATSSRSLTGNVTVSDLTAAALAKFFSLNSGTTYASAVSGSVVKEIVDNASGEGGGATCASVWNCARASYTGAGTFGEGMAIAPRRD